MSNEHTPENVQPGWQPPPGSDPWAATPPPQRPDLPPEGGPASPFSGPSGNAWPPQFEPTASQPAPEANPYATQQQPPAAPWGDGAWAPAPSAQSWPPATPMGPGERRRDANPFAALFDFSFTKFATPGLVKIVYILQVIAAVGAWLSLVLGAFAADSFARGLGVGIFALFFGWIPVLLSIAFTRFILESIVALIRIHDRVNEMADRTHPPSA